MGENLAVVVSHCSEAFHSLKYPHEDAKVVAKCYGTQQDRFFDSMEVWTLLKDKASGANIRAERERMNAQTQTTEMAILFLSSRSMTDDAGAGKAKKEDPGELPGSSLHDMTLRFTT